MKNGVIGKGGMLPKSAASAKRVNVPGTNGTASDAKANKGKMAWGDGTSQPNPKFTDLSDGLKVSTKSCDKPSQGKNIKAKVL